ncbi:ORF310 [Staphylococcus phage Twort]|nr:ORF310 [Staphylococcus phage Twort]AAX92481.1 ORF310 [Staphylococcus phage Twort]
MVASLLSILVEAMYEEKVIDQKVLDKIEEYQNKLYEKEDE